MVSWKWTLSLALGTGAAIGSLVYAALVPKGPAKAFVEPASQRVVASPGTNKLTATYKITNRGGRDLVLGAVKTSCGCSVASIQPKVLSPGHAGIITVNGMPLNAGEKTVEIHVETNTDDGLLKLSLTMVGSQQIPYVAVDSGPIRFGVIRTASSAELIRIETREKKSAKPWIEAATSDLPYLVIHGGVDSERPLGGDVLLRSYRFTAELTRVPDTGNFNGEAIFKSRGAYPAPALRLPVYGTVRPPVFAAPSSLYTSHGPHDEAPILTLTLTSDDDFDLRAEPITESADALGVRQVSRAGGRVVFEVRHRQEPNESISTSLAFKTNHPNVPIIRVPAVFRLTGR